ncbi:MAG TPA: hypothetical protein VNZ45_02460, partial [Bacteroidia bacterium]|nr:hypothetical protein [Bacteroidia bacterium]
FFTVVTVDNKITVMSPNSIIGYANQFFWIGLDQFYFFNGIVQTLPNTVNADYFFATVNLSQRSKIWAEIVSPRLGMTEIWWHFPMGTATECNHALIYHIELKIWYDTTISRSAGAPANIFPYPMMADNVLTTFATRIGPIQAYPLWMHEFNFDKVISPSNITAIDSYFEGHIYDFFEGNPANNRAMRNRRVEPDFSLNNGGSMTLVVNNRFFPSDTTSNGQIIKSGPYVFDMNTQKIDAVTSQGRLVSFRFESNQLGGSYQMGKTLLNYNIGDDRPAGAGTAGTGS